MSHPATFFFRIKRVRDKYESEMKELERSERHVQVSSMKILLGLSKLRFVRRAFQLTFHHSSCQVRLGFFKRFSVKAHGAFTMPISRSPCEIWWMPEALFLCPYSDNLPSCVFGVQPHRSVITQQVKDNIRSSAQNAFSP